MNLSDFEVHYSPKPQPHHDRVKDAPPKRRKYDKRIIGKTSVIRGTGGHKMPNPNLHIVLNLRELHDALYAEIKRKYESERKRLPNGDSETE